MFAQLGYYICVPFAWLTRLFYTWTGSYGVALILFTLLVKLVLLPFQLKSKKSMLRMNRMQSKIKDIQTRYANNREKQQQEMADLYAREGVNPMSGCLWSFLPFPILIALYYIIRTHMFPLTLAWMPRSKEGWLVCFADKHCASKETSKKKSKTADPPLSST